MLLFIFPIYGKKKERNKREREKKRKKTDTKISQFDNAFVCNISRAGMMNP